MALGKKLNSLLDSYFGEESDFDVRVDKLIELDIFKIQTSPHQPRTHFDDAGIRSLATNIEEHGLLQPITVIEISPDVFQLISGERRLKAFRILNKETIPAIVKDTTKLDEKQRATLSLFENLQREDLSPMDTARAFWKLRELHGWTNQTLAEFMNCSKQHIDNYFRLFDLDMAVQDMLAQNKITEGHARLLHGLSPELQIDVADKIITEQLSIKATQRFIDSLTKVTKIKVLDASTRSITQHFQNRFPECKVVFNGTREAGSLVIKWSRHDAFPNL
jgi:ParB family transcriptional regulator, chromosome partitioning protein